MMKDESGAMGETLDSALYVLDDAEADYDFFLGLFDEPDLGDATDSDASSSLSSLSNSTRSDRRRQRWHGAPETTDLSVVIRLPPQGSMVQHHRSKAWEQVAKSQKKARQAAEKENAELREMLRKHQLTIQKMFKLTQKVGTLAEAMPGATTDYLGPELQLDQLKVELDLLALEADVVLSSGAFASNRDEFREISRERVESALGDELHLVVETAWVLPFSLEDVAKAAWNQLAKTTPKEILYSIEEVYKDTEMCVNHVIAGPKEDDGVSGIMHTQIAMRRCPPAADGSILLILKTNARFITVKNTWVGSANGEGFVRVTKQKSLSTGPLSRIAFCRRSRAQPPADANLSATERSKWMDVAMKGPMKGSDQRVDKVVQALENLLLNPSDKPE